jgi:type VI secretion system secreted protein VgrG
MVANDHVNVASGQSVHVAAGKSLIGSIGQKLSLFVQNAGMKLFAGKGKVEIQAQSDNVEVTAQKAVKVVSATDRIEIAADQGILLTSGGAYILVKDGNVDIHAPGKIDVRGASHSFSGPTSTNFVMPHLPQGVAAPTDLEFRLVDPYGRPSPGVEYKVTLSNGSEKHGVLDADGYAKVSGVPAGTNARVHYLADRSPPRSEVGIRADSDWGLFQSIKVAAKPLADTGHSNDIDPDATV